MAPNSSKKRRAGFQISKLLDITQFIDNSGSEIGLPEKKKRKRGRPKLQKQKAKTYVKATTVEDFDNDSDDQVMRPEMQRASKIHSHNQKKILNNLKMAAAAFLSTINNSENIESLLQNLGFETVEDINKVEEDCGNIARLLRARRAEDKKPTRKARTLEPFDEYFIFRDGTTRIMLLAPMEIFQANRAIKNKTFGFVRREDQYWPLMCAISGSVSCVQNHGKLLDNQFWSAQTFRVGDFHGHDFRTNGWEARRGALPGTDFASHVEPKLMLWFAWSLLRRVTGETHAVEKEVGMLYKLRRIPERITAEIVISRDPCMTCRKFQHMIEEICGKINFKFIVVPNLGVLNLERNKSNHQVLPLLADLESAGVIPDSEDEQDEEPETQIQVVIRQKPASESQANINSSQHVQKRDGNRRSRFSTQVTVSQATDLAKFYNTSKSTQPKKTSRKASSEEDYDESDYVPPSRGNWKTDQGDTSTPAKKVTRNGLTPPDSNLFSFDTLECAQRVNREKRKREHGVETSPTPAKKSRHIRFRD